MAINTATMVDTLDANLNEIYQEGLTAWPTEYTVCFNVLNEKDKIRKALEQTVSLIGCEDQFLQTSSIGQ